MIELREDQRAVKRDVRKAYARGHRRVLLRCVTGWGKTAVSVDLIADAVKRGRRVLFLAPLQEIALDTRGRIQNAGIACGLAMDGIFEGEDSPVMVALPWTLIARKKFPAADFVIVDECHHLLSSTYLSVMDNYADAWWLLLTATPERADGKPLGAFADTIVIGPSERECAEAGLIAPVRVIAVAEAPRPKTLPCSPFDAWKRWTPGEPAIVFCNSIAYAKKVASDWGSRAIALTGHTKHADRVSARKRIEDGSIDALTVVGIGIEGFDCPRIAVSILATTDGFIGPYLQRIGRCRRRYPGKTHGTLIDLVGSVYLHGMPDEDRRWSLTGDAVISVSGGATSTQRCPHCLAAFPRAKHCPECGEEMTAKSAMPRELSNADKLATLQSIPLNVRREAYLRKMRSVAKIRFPYKSDLQQEEWALAETERRVRVEPEKAAGSSPNTISREKATGT